MFQANTAENKFKSLNLWTSTSHQSTPLVNIHKLVLEYGSSLWRSPFYIYVGFVTFFIFFLHFLCHMQIFDMEWSISEASDRFGTMLTVSGILENIILHVFLVFQLQHGSTIWRFGMVDNFGMNNRIVLKLVAIERACKTG